jgi:hypothetical protein
MGNPEEIAHGIAWDWLASIPMERTKAVRKTGSEEGGRATG